MQRRSFAGMLIAVGIVYGDIGTSPLYTMSAIMHSAGKMGNVTPDYIIGAVSLVFWTLMLITTIKYVSIALRADNHGEGGIFSLYARVRHSAGKWLIIPALIGGAALLADGTLTPAVTVTTAIEGLKGVSFFPDDQQVVLWVVTVIIALIFLAQRLGTAKIGRAFGPIMLVWFGFIGLAGLLNLVGSGHYEILKALSPWYALKVLVSPENPVGLFILGSVFLATTGAEALYSDMGHVGKHNIYATWPFVYTMLALSYFGQGAWVLANYQNPAMAHLTEVNPFYDMLGQDWRLFGIIIATIAAIIASQALITGAFTLVNEAIGLKLLPRLRIIYPTTVRSQMYIRTVNWMLGASTLFSVWLFRTSSNMEGAYSLPITVTMLMTTILLTAFVAKEANRWWATLLLIVFGSIEFVFFIGSLGKFLNGGFFTAMLMLALLVLMAVWHFGNKYRERIGSQDAHVSLRDFRKQLVALSQDESEPIYATNLIYLTKMYANYEIKRLVLYSILDRRPKRAQVYWFVNVKETDNPYEKRYSVDMMGTRNVAYVTLYLGFRQDQNISRYLHQIVRDLIQEGAIDPQYPKYTANKLRHIGDFKYVLMQSKIIDVNMIPQLTGWQRLVIGGRIWLENHATTPSVWYGLEFSEVTEETVPFMLDFKQRAPIQATTIKNTIGKKS
ncbi:MAG TPA: KUP/HAK/KT family potassium transporter [Lactobacillaceae bacterium]